jgi:hypothetical protein
MNTSHSTWHALLVEQLCLAVVAAGVAGCAESENFYFQMILESEQAMRRPLPLVITIPTQTEAPVKLGDLEIKCPQGWRVKIRKDYDKSADSEFPHSWLAQLGSRSEGGDIEVDFLYMQGRTYLRNTPQEFLDIMLEATREPDRVLSKYKTDFALFEAACKVVPDDYRRAFLGEEREVAKTLLYLKRRRMFVGWQFSLTSVQGFMACHGYGAPPPLIAVDLFDMRGAYRGALDVCFPDNFPRETAVQVVGQILYGSRFTEGVTGPSTP